MPYPFAHPAAVIPLARPLGRFAVPSALAIGSMAPDFWYLVPLLERGDSHSLAGLAWFCLPAGLIIYALFHLVLKQPLIALLSPRLGAFTPAALPEVPLRAVMVSLLAGGLTHLAWDALTHSYYGDGVQGHKWLQHASTALGTMALGWWSWRKLRLAAAAPAPLSPVARVCILLALFAAAALAAWVTAGPPAADLRALRQFLRTGGFAAVHSLSVALLVYCLLFQRKMLRRAA
jgi:hypothetical protein